jgi:1-acyl-sn-glycerol-3-phosphate acyltransferase
MPSRSEPARLLPLPPPAPTQWLRLAWQFVGVWLAVLWVALPLALLVVASFGLARRWAMPGFVRAWGRLTLWVCGVRLEVEPAVAAEVARKRRRVIVIDHGSTLDLFVMSALWPPDTVGVVKREMMFVPVLGQAMWLVDFQPIDRRNHQRATASIARAAARCRERDLTVFIAPEGTRSETGQLQPFKLGAFHLAAAADAPIVPLVFHGTRWLWPRFNRNSRSGVVTVRMLPEQPSGAADPSSEAIHARAQHLHDLYAAELQRMAATVPVVDGAPPPAA